MGGLSAGLVYLAGFNLQSKSDEQAGKSPNKDHLPDANTHGQP